MAIISDNELRQYFSVEIPTVKPYEATIAEKKENIRFFNELERTGLEYGAREKRLLLYATKLNEKVYVQYPGKETVRLGEKKNENDFRPVLVMPDGEVHDDMVFKNIWDIVANIGKNVRGSLDILAVLFLKMAYLLDYKYNEKVEYICEVVENEVVVSSETVEFSWHSLLLPDDIIDTLNNLFSRECNGISFEAFIYYNDLLAQNEDCKYFIEKTPTRGRINNILSHLTVISFFRDRIGLSKVIDSFNRTGVAPIPIQKIQEACGDLVVLRDTRKEKLQQELEDAIQKQVVIEQRLIKAKEKNEECKVGLKKLTKGMIKELTVAQNQFDRITEKINKIREKMA